MSKLIDFESNWQALANSDNVFALVVMAQVKMKFSTVLEWSEIQIANDNLTELDQWIEGVLTTDSLEELLQKH